MTNERRNFIKQSCKLCASLAGITFLMNSLQSCAPLHYYEPQIDQGTINVPVSQFIEGANMVIVKNKSLEYDIAVVKTGSELYKAFELKCTHQANSLVVTKTGFFCNLHGSSFDLNGKVNTSPASVNLKEYLLNLNSEIITIKL